jgi:hypothetical protein
MAAMLSRLGGRGYQVHETTASYDMGQGRVDPDFDGDFDPEEEKPQRMQPLLTLDSRSTGQYTATADPWRAPVFINPKDSLLCALCASAVKNKL